MAVATRHSSSPTLMPPLPSSSVRSLALTEGSSFKHKSSKTSTLHKEAELKSVNYDGSDSSEDDGPVESEAKLSVDVQSSNPFEVCRRDNESHLLPAKYSPQPVRHQRSINQQTSPHLPLSANERMLLAAKQGKKGKPPNYMDIPWYHPNINRHVAESLLLAKNTPDGTYLLRQSSVSDCTLTLSVSYKTSVKHYRVTWDGKQLCFGLGRFKTLPEFLDHFRSRPIISGESGILVYLCHPYPRQVNEPIEYEEPVFTEGLDVLGLNVESNPSCLSINSKDGFLTKLGHHRKNWKLRWFKLFKNQLAYYPSHQSSSPLRIINLSDVLSVDRDHSMNKDFCFKLETTYRTFYMYAQTDLEANEWVAILKWKLENEAADLTAHT